MISRQIKEDYGFRYLLSVLKIYSTYFYRFLILAVNAASKLSKNIKYFNLLLIIYDI